nr:hypothetical protein [Phyllobacterium sp. KW56]
MSVPIDAWRYAKLPVKTSGEMRLIGETRFRGYARKRLAVPNL